MTHLRRSKSLLIQSSFLNNPLYAKSPLSPLREAIDSLVEFIDNDPDISFLDVLKCASQYKIFSIPPSLSPFSENIESTDNAPADDENKDSKLNAISHFLNTPFHQIESYKAYISGDGEFDTHQGVKGREFDRVFVVMDDEEAGEGLFSYEKLFEVKSLTKGDNEKSARGEETGIDRTRRLFYVTCTRAERSLALVAYSNDPNLLRQNLINKRWFNEEEVIIL